MDYSIGEMARRTGVKVTTIRYYEGRGLIDSPARTEGGQRRYDRKALDRLSFLRHARDLGFGLEDISELLALAEHPGEDCAPAHDIARRQLATVERRIAALVRLRTELRRLAEADDPGTAGDCRVIDVLGDHDLCLGPHEGAAPATDPLPRG